MEKLLVIDKFETPYSKIPDRESAFVRIKKYPYNRGYYRMEGVRGYELCLLKIPIQVTCLEVKTDHGWKTLMVDDPLHWIGMEELSNLSRPGVLLTSGLGLGLVLHHLVKRNDLTKIVVVEIDPEIISFFKPYLPVDPRIEIINENLIQYLMRYNEEPFDTVIIDIFVFGEKSEETRKQIQSSMLGIYWLAKWKFPKAKVLLWGIRGYELDMDLLYRK